MKKILFIGLAIGLFLTNGCINCGEPLRLIAYFIPKRLSDNTVLVGSSGTIPIDSLQLYLMRINNSDTILQNVTSTSFDTYAQRDSIIGIELNDNAFRFLLRYSSTDTDTIVFNVRDKGRKSCHGQVFDFIYNAQTICTNCDLDDIHIIKK